MEIDWEQRRYEIAKEVLAAFLSNACQRVWEGTIESQTQLAIEFSDALIEKLKWNTEK